MVTTISFLFGTSEEYSRNAGVHKSWACLYAKTYVEFYIQISFFQDRIWANRWIYIDVLVESPFVLQ